MADRAHGDGLRSESEQRQRLFQHRHVGVEIAARPVGRDRTDEPQPLGMLGLALTADLRHQLTQGKDVAQPLRHARRVQLLEHGRFPGDRRVVDAAAALGDAVPQHRREGALPHDGRVDVAMTELEVRAGPRRAVPDHAARPHHGMERVHADEGARHGHAHIIQSPREAVDHLLQRQVAQARCGQPVGKRPQGHVMPAAASSCPWAAPRSARRSPRAA